MSIVDWVAATIQRHGMLSAGQRVGVAVSGGADSVCLLHVLRELAPRWRLRLVVLHLDHGLRGPESRGDADFVSGLAGALGLESVVRRVELAAFPGNLEEAGRVARLAFFREAMGSGAADRVALGHTRSDQAETVLFRFLRGAGTAGLAAIRPVTADGIVRPLIETPRYQVEAFLRGRGLDWREDSTNASPRFARNRIRHDLLPYLAREWNPRIEEALAQTADWALAEEHWWEAEVDRLWETRAVERDQAVILRARDLRDLPAAAARRLVRRALQRAKGDLRSVAFSHVEAVLRLAAREAGAGGFEAPGVAVQRSFDWLRFCRAEAAPALPYAFPATPPARFRLPGTGAVISLELVEKPKTSLLSDCVYNSEMGSVDWGQVSGSLTLRSWRPGDRLQPAGGASSKKLKALFQRARIPSWERATWPVLACGSSVVWTRRFGVSAEVMAKPSSRFVLWIRECLEPLLNSESETDGITSKG